LDLHHFQPQILGSRFQDFRNRRLHLVFVINDFPPGFLFHPFGIQYFAHLDIRLQTDGTFYREQLGDGFFTYCVEDEAGKLDINALSNTTGIILRNLIVQLGYPQEIADMVVDSILDWKDIDELHRLNGAESDYYQTLPNPCKAKNASFDTLEELLLVKGVTPELLYGNGKQKGLAAFLTVFAKTNKIQINAAPRELLASIPGMTDDLMENIMTARTMGQIGKIRDLQNVIANKCECQPKIDHL